MPDSPLKYSFFKRNGLTLFFLALFIITLVAQAFTGWKQNNQEIQEKGGQALTFGAYLGSGHFFSATFENFQSEFLQMGMYVLCTVGLRQIGSAESKSMEGEEEVDREPKPGPDAPFAVRKGGWLLWVYSNSLSLCFLGLFLLSWAGHLYGSFTNHNDEQMLMHKPQEDLLTYLSEPEFWFETFQNWQSEFLSIVSIVFLTIYLRQKGSPESKPVDAPHMETGK
ncbi:hypothetical protein DYU05_09675 [Mucilaginibacter terrenus]|uniref:Transmembrane protein n=1 Tax=Mucilaginibacter terrenus TaxID=2482727 RepID=A0A3E2NXX9_9SPHI|nr:DUF6766 family protein [Mucilaginibacter terrenus]RFZ85837.1 hypothetical protein DYU05_09675 [Mucilaginibacter terrenus]